MNLLEQAAIFLVTAVIVVPLFRRMQPELAVVL